MGITGRKSLYSLMALAMMLLPALMAHAEGPAAVSVSAPSAIGISGTPVGVSTSAPAVLGAPAPSGALTLSSPAPGATNPQATLPAVISEKGTSSLPPGDITQQQSPAKDASSTNKDSKLFVDTPLQPTAADVAYMSAAEKLMSAGEDIATMRPQPFRVGRLTQFGYSFFNKSTAFAPVIDVPVGADYIIGPGDTLVLTSSGSLDGTFQLEVNRSGEVILPKIGAVRVWGVPFGKVHDLLKASLTQVFRTVQVNVTMGKLRLIKVYLVGEVDSPGDYNISSLSTVINALAAAGGPSKNGTLRAIQLIRAGKVVETVDLYDFFLKGDKSRDIRLQPGDTIHIPIHGNLVGIGGNVRKPAIYEFQKESDLKELLDMAGGVPPSSYLQRIQLSRTVANDRRLANGETNLSGVVAMKRISLGKLPLGWYSVSFATDVKNGNTPELHNFSVIPRLSDRSKIDPENSFFGTHIEITSDGLLAAKLLGFRLIRLHAPLITKWHAIEEKKGVYSYNDKAISEIKRQGFGIVGTLDRTALWASTGKADPKTKSSNFYGAYSYLPEEWGLWEKYVSAVVNHYKNDISYWQIWNEPDIPFLVPPEGISNASAYDTLVRDSESISRENNSKTTILGGVAYLRQIYFGPGRQVDFIEEMAKLKTPDKLDVFTFHHYISKQENTKKLETNFDTVKTILKDPKRRYWVTELGIECSGSNKYEFLNSSACSSPINAASQSIKFNVILLAKGVEKIFYYNLFFDTNGLGEFMPGVNVAWDSKEPRPIVNAYAIMTWLLDGSAFGNEVNKNGYQEYTFYNGTKTIKVAWATDGATQTYHSTKEAKFISMDGSRTSKGPKYQLTDEPVFILF